MMGLAAFAVEQCFQVAKSNAFSKVVLEIVLLVLLSSIEFFLLYM